MSIVKLNNRSVKDITAFGSISSLGSLTHIATQTASSSASLSFTSGIDSTYKEYIFYLVDIHPATDDANFLFNMSIDSGSNYNVTKTSTFFRSYHQEDASQQGVSYYANGDLAQSTGTQLLSYGCGNDNDQCTTGFLHLFNPSSTTFVKHFIARGSATNDSDDANDIFLSGYFNTTSAIDAMQFKFYSGNIDAGTIKLYGIKDS